MNGAISSLVFVPDTTTDNGTSWNVSDDKKFILSGDWNLAANSGTITKFYVNFTKVLLMEQDGILMNLLISKPMIV